MLDFSFATIYCSMRLSQLLNSLADGLVERGAMSSREITNGPRERRAARNVASSQDRIEHLGGRRLAWRPSTDQEGVEWLGWHRAARRATDDQLDTDKVPKNKNGATSQRGAEYQGRCRMTMRHHNILESKRMATRGDKAAVSVPNDQKPEGPLVPTRATYGWSADIVGAQTRIVDALALGCFGNASFSGCHPYRGYPRFLW